MNPSELIKRFCVEKGSGFRIDDIDPDDVGGIDKGRAKALLQRSTDRLAELQELLHADRSWAVLIILQGTDASGKDSLVKHVLSGVNPQGCEVHSFAAPSSQELAHDFLWRTTLALPARGRIGIFNRSYYEETLVVRVHPELLARQKLPVADDQIWQQRFEDIAAFERHLARNGTLVLKFFLHVSRDEQAKRLLERIDDPEKHWKFAAEDLGERKLRDQYMHAYQETIRHTAAPEAPWYVVPADHKWFTRAVVAAAIVERMDALGLRYPPPSEEEQRAMAKARAVLRAELPEEKPKADKPKRKAGREDAAGTKRKTARTSASET
jgi:PPK2 family polyphosphate:nucleotide phosphotransferase